MPNTITPVRRKGQGAEHLAAMALRTGLSALLRPSALAPAKPLAGQPPVVRAARRLNRASAVLAFSVLADSAVEHYRGSFRNRVMWLPLGVSTAVLGVAAHGTADARPAIHRLRDAVYGLAALTGLTGTGIHFWNVSKRVGGWSWHNFFYGAPVGAPMALLLSGLLGLYSERLRDAARAGASLRSDPKVLGLPAGRALAALAAAGLVGTIGEVGLMHFRGRFQNPAMYLPVAVPPVAALLLADAALGKAHRRRWFTRLWVRFTALLGLAGVGFHIYGVSRAMGGWRNWRQNLVNGPPLPAPPSFTGLALAGLAALGLLDDHPDA
ncbi:MAG TPA: hypothetical protein VL574_13875 [Stellaceae bacterium]|nr:hypothetical protein [Stellaceae bacterium]